MGCQNGRNLLTALSQYVSRTCFELGLLGISTVHLPPNSQVGSSHFGSTPSLKRWKSVPGPSQLGGLMLLYKLQTQEKVICLLSVSLIFYHYRPFYSAYASGSETHDSLHPT